jgi:hypothetical protein
LGAAVDASRFDFIRFDYRVPYFFELLSAFEFSSGDGRF